MRYVPLVLISSYLIRLLSQGASIGDSLVMISLTALYGYFMFLDSKKETPVNKELKDRIVEIETSLQETKSKVSGLTLASGLKRNG